MRRIKSGRKLSVKSMGKPKKRGLTKTVYSITFKNGKYINTGLFKRRQQIGLTKGMYKEKGREVIEVTKIKKPSLMQRLRAW